MNCLQRAERRIELLSGVDAEGNPITQPLGRHGHDRPGRARQTPQPASLVAEIAREQGSSPLFGETGMDEPDVS